MSSPTAALRSPSNAVVGGLRSPANKDDQSQTSSIDPINKDDISKHANLIKSSLTTMFQPLYRKEHRMELIATSSSDNISKNGVQTYPFHYGEGYDLTPKPVTHRIEIDPNLFPTGKDTGNGSKQLITTYLEHVIDTKQPTRQQHVQLKRITNEFRDLTFDEQLEHVELRNIPYESSVAIQKALLPKHSSDAKKFFIMLTTALRENDATLVRLRLSNMAITDFIVQQLSKGICRNTFLQYLILNNNAITDHGIESLCSALRWHPTCHSIWLGGNKVTDIGLRHLALLCHRNPVITELNLANKWPTHASAKELELHPFITSVGVEYLCNQLKKEYSQLTSLSLANQRIRDTGASKLFEILPLTTLRTLNLTNNELSSTCCVALQESLRQNPILEELIVSKNQLDDVGVIEIATGLAFNSNLSTLDISYNQVHMKGLYALYQCLQYNTTLTSLITVGNEAKDERAENLVANRSRSIFVFPSMSMSPANSSGGPSPSFAAGSSPFHGRAKSIVPNSMKELRASLSMNPEEEMKKSDVEHEQNRRSSPQHSPTRKTRRSYGSFAEFAQSPFRSSIRQNSFKAGASSDEEGNDGPVGLVADANTLANSNGIETLGRKKRDKSIMSGMDLLYDDELSIKEGEVEVEEADDDDSVQQRVREKLQTASKKTRGGPINIQDAIATAVSIVEELEREEADRPHTGETKRKRHMKDSGVSLTVDVSSPSNFKRKGGAAGKATTPGQSLIKQSSGLQRMNSNNSLNSDKATNSPSLAKTTATVPSSSSAKAILQQDVKKTSKSKKKKKVRLQTTATVGGDEDTDGTHSGADSDADSLGSNSIAGGDDADDNASINSVNSNGTHRSEKGGKSLNELMKERRARKQNNGGFTPKVGLANKPVPINPFELSSEERQKYFDKHVPVFAQETKAIATLKNRRLSQDYGKTLGVPHIKSMGIRPIRTSISAYADSGQHLMYLRVATEDDPDDTRPYSIIKIGLDKRDERDRIRQSRQTEAYKLAKMELMTQKAKEKPQQAAVSRVPEKFWRNWRMKMRDNYPDGIDEADNCKSTKLEPILIPRPPSAAEQLEGVEDPYSMYDRSDPNGPWNRYLASKADEKLAYQKHLGFKARYFPPGDVLAARRKENELRKHRELLALQNPEVPVVAKKKIGYNVVAGKQAEKKKFKYDSDDSDEEEDNMKRMTKQAQQQLQKGVTFQSASRPNTGNHVDQSNGDGIPKEVFLSSSPLPSKPGTPLLLSPPSTAPPPPSALKPQPSNSDITFIDNQQVKSNKRLQPLNKTTSMMMRQKTTASTFVLKHKYAIKKNELIKTR